MLLPYIYDNSTVGYAFEYIVLYTVFSCIGWWSSFSVIHAVNFEGHIDTGSVYVYVRSLVRLDLGVEGHSRCLQNKYC